MNSCAHPHLFSMSGRFGLLLSPIGVRCQQCSRRLHLRSRDRLLALGLIVVLPAVLGVLMHSGMAGLFSGTTAFLVLMVGRNGPGLHSALRDDSRANKPHDLLLALMIASLPLVLFAFIIFFPRSPFDDKAFDAAAWGALTSFQERAYMADDLIERHLPKGMPQASVLALLGPPESPRPPPQQQPRACTFQYQLGVWLDHGDDVWLSIFFDSTGSLTRAERQP